VAAQVLRGKGVPFPREKPKKKILPKRLSKRVRKKEAIATEKKKKVKE